MNFLIYVNKTVSSCLTLFLSLSLCLSFPSNLLRIGFTDWLICFVQVSNSLFVFDYTRIKKKRLILMLQLMRPNRMNAPGILRNGFSQFSKIGL